MKRQNRKALLVEKASELFLKKGYMRVSLAEIATTCDMNQGNVYYYFKTKREIAAAVLGHCDAELKTVFLSLEELPPLERLKTFLTHIEKRTANYVEWGCPIAGLTVEMILDLGEDFEDNVPAVYRTYLSWFEENLIQAGLAKKAASKESLLLLSGLQGAFHTAHLLKSEEVIPLYIENICTRLDRLTAAQMVV